MMAKEFGTLVEDFAGYEQPNFGTLVEEGGFAESRGKIGEAARDVRKQSLLGAAKGGLGAYGNLLDLMSAQPTETLPGEKAQRGAEFDLLEKMSQPGYKPTAGELQMLVEDDVAPRCSRLSSSEDVENLAKMLDVDTEAQTAPGRFAGRISEAVGGAAALGAGPAPLGAIGLGAVGGQGAEELGAPAWLSSAIEVATSLTPSGFAKKLAPRAKAAKEIVKSGRGAKLTEREITPLIQSEKKLGTLSKLARKGEKTQKTFKKIETKLGDFRGSVVKQAEKLPPLPLSQKVKLQREFRHVIKDLNTTLEASADKKKAITFIEKAMKKLRNKEATPADLVGFWPDINETIDWTKMGGGDQALVRIKKPLLEAIKKSSPELATEFENYNALYTKFKKASKALSPDKVDKWINKIELGAVTAAIATFNPILLKGVATEAAIRTISKEMLTNPRLQNISMKMLRAIRNNKTATAAQLARQTQKIMKKDHPDEDWGFLVLE